MKPSIQTSVRKTIQAKCNSNLAVGSKKFGTISTAGELPIVLVPRTRFMGMFITIPAGVSCIMQKYGKHCGEFQPGMHFAPPYYRCAYMVTKQACTYNYDVVNCPTKDNVMVEVDVTVVFKIIDATKFVYHLGAQKFDEYLQAVSEEAIRSMVRLILHSNIYELRGSGADELLRVMNDKFKLFGVLFVNATITNVKLPSDVAKALQRSTTLDQKIKEQQKSHEFDIKCLNDRHDLQLQDLKLENERGIAELQAEINRLQVELESDKAKAMRSMQVAIIKCEEQLSVLKKNAEVDLLNEKITQQSSAELLLKDTEADLRRLKLEAEAYSEREVIKSETTKVNLEMEAELLSIQGKTEQSASKSLLDKRNHELKLKTYEALGDLARNGRILVNGKHGDQLIDMLTTSNATPTI